MTPIFPQWAKDVTSPIDGAVHCPTTSRIKRITYKLVCTNQSAYIKGHFISESVRLIKDLLEYADQENEDGILFAFDIEKAFDSVEHSYIYATHENGFGGNITQWIRILFKV